MKLTLVTRQDCHLCHEMVAVVQEVRSKIPLEMELRDVDSDEDLLLRFGEEVPVLLVNGRKAFKYRVTAKELRQRLDAERRRGM